MTISRWVVVLTCVAALFGAACGNQDADSGDTPTVEERLNSGEVQVTAENFAFSPTSIPVEAGARIQLTFTNNDSTQHSFTAEDLGVDLVVDGGQSDNATFTAPDSGSVEWVCKFHDSMSGTITTDGSAAGSGNSEDDGDLDY